MVVSPESIADGLETHDVTMAFPMEQAASISMDWASPRLADTGL
ncbi:MAG: hypothetical protein ACSLFB_09100 [Acidimicrobiales bacterium]